MPRISYLGPHEEVELPVLGVVARRGVPIDVEDEDIAKNLVAQGWKAETSKRGRDAPEKE